MAAVKTNVAEWLGYLRQDWVAGHYIDEEVVVIPELDPRHPCTEIPALDRLPPTSEVSIWDGAIMAFPANEHVMPLKQHFLEWRRNAVTLPVALDIDLALVPVLTGALADLAQLKVLVTLDVHRENLVAVRSIFESLGLDIPPSLQASDPSVDATPTGATTP